MKINREYCKGLLVGLAVAAMAISPLTQAKSEGAASALTPMPEPSTFARFVPERLDDFAWENDLIAFRAYGPAARKGAENAGVDCWLKRVDYPIINKWYQLHFEQGLSYHKDNGEGLDNYHVGSSAGCGSTALWLEGERQPLEAYTEWEIISQTQEKTVFQLTYQNLVGKDTYKEQKLITIELGKRLYHAQSTFYKNGKVAKNLPVVVGLTTHDEKAITQVDVNKGWLANWETLQGSGLGTAVVLQPELIEQAIIVPSKGVKDRGHALYLVNTDNKGVVEYYAGYGWERAGEITSFDKWQAYLNGFKPNF